jgi:hypothetical protein
MLVLKIGNAELSGRPSELAMMVWRRVTVDFDAPNFPSEDQLYPPMADHALDAISSTDSQIWFALVVAAFDVIEWLKLACIWDSVARHLPPAVHISQTLPHQSPVCEA